MTAPTVPPTGRNPARSGQREAARDHLIRLRQQGGTYRSIAAATAVSPGTLRALASGRRRAQPGTATAVLKVTRRTLPRPRLDAAGTRLRLRALHVMGHGSARIARAVGVSDKSIRKLVRGDARTVSPQLRDAIAELYDAWWDKRAPGRTRFERGAATTAQTRHRRELVRRRRPRRRPARHPRLPARVRLETRHRHRHRPRHPSARPPQKESPMTNDDRMTWGFIFEVLDVLDRHGYRRSDNQHTGQAIGLIRDVAHVYEGTIDAPHSAYVAVPPSPPAAPPPPGRAGQDAVVLTSADVSTVFAALDIAADYKRDRAAACADCADQTCLTCQSRHRDAHAYDQMAARILRAAEASAAAGQRGADRAEPARTHPQAAPDRAAGQ
jgi:transcriptional regulator with XRE-family HTH domain